MLKSLLVSAIALTGVVLFLRQRLAPEVVAVLILAALAVPGLVTLEEALSGFSNPATIAVGAMFVLSAALRETGSLDRIGAALIRVGINGSLLMLATVLLVAAVSAFVNNTAAVAVFLPIVLATARRRRVTPSKLLVPLSFASQFGGVCTLIGTSTNLLVNSLAVGAGHPGFGLFDFAPVGLTLVGVGTLYLATVGWWLLPHREAPESVEDSYALRPFLFPLRVLAESRVLGKSPAAVLRRDNDVLRLVEVVRADTRLLPGAVPALETGDVLVVEGPAEEVLGFARDRGLEPESRRVALEGDGLQLVEALVPPNSAAIGRRFHETVPAGFAGAVPLALASRGSVLREQVASAPLRAGDVLLLLVDGTELTAMRDDSNFTLLGVRANPLARGQRARYALAAIAGVVVATALGLLPLAIAAMLSAALVVVARCLSAPQALRAIDLRVLVLIAAMLPLGIALEKTGLARAIVDGVLRVVPANPTLALAILYGMTMLLTEVISNNATAVLMTPIAIAMATSLGVAATPMIAAVAFAASTSFSTPIGYQTNTMVFSAGGYEFRDFLRIGVPLNLLFWITSVWILPKVFPF
jgi:di/tricarboxylate transporter